MIDFHSHLDLYPDPPSVVAACCEQGDYVLSVTTTPRVWQVTLKLAAKAPQITTALGLHEPAQADGGPLWAQPDVMPPSRPAPLAHLGPELSARDTRENVLVALAEVEIDLVATIFVDDRSAHTTDASEHLVMVGESGSNASTQVIFCASIPFPIQQDEHGRRN